MNRVFYKSCESMADIPDGSVQTCVTSPPYFGLRDYGVDEQIGLEPTLDAYIERLVRVFREVRRTLRDDGTLWLNLGDSYAGSWGAQGRAVDPNATRGLTSPQSARKSEMSALARQSIEAHPQFKSRTGSGRDVGDAKPKDLLGVPWAVAFALRGDGWWLRSDIVWWKVPCMPESIEDRPTRAHEFIFLLSKSARYYYDADAIREPLTESSIERLAQNVAAQTGSYRQPGKTNGAMKAVQSGGEMREWVKAAVKDSWCGECEEWFKAQRNEKPDFPKRGHLDRCVCECHGWEPGTRRTREGSEGQQVHPEGVTHTLGQDDKGANKRDVWKIAPAQYSDAHFATFPPEIPSLCIRAGSKPGDLVLDPFAGSGTTLEVAEGLGRAWVGYELNEGYRPLIEARLKQRGLFSA